MTTPEKNKPNQNKIQLIGVVFFSFYILGFLFPDYWWSTHFIKFLDPITQFVLLGTSFTFLLYGFLKPLKAFNPISKLINSNISSIFLLLLAIISGFIFYYFPMAQDFYGESYLLNPHIGSTLNSIPEGTDEALFHFGIAPWDGQKTILSLITYFTYFLGWNYHDSFLLFDALFGFLFIGTWFYFIQTTIRSTKWKILLILIGVTSPFMLNFYGHIEINAPVYWANLTWMVLANRYLKSKSNRALLGLVLFLLLAIKLHAVALLFTPALILIIIDKTKPHLNISWGHITRFLFLPILFLGAIAYFFIFKDHKDERQLTDTAMEYDRLFLPLISPPAPLDKYNMLSFNHIFDYFSEMLLWSPVALFLILIIFLFYKKEIDWNSFTLKITATSLVLFGALFFVTNPLLTMQMDWDLFAMPSPILLVLLVVLIQQIENTSLLQRSWTSVISISVILIPMFLVHFNVKSLSYRLESVGIRIYHTYYEWSALTIRNSLGLLWEDRDFQLNRKDKILTQLHPYAVIGNDREYGALWYQEGKYFFDHQKNYEQALHYLKMAKLYSPKDDRINHYLMQANFITGNYPEAYKISLELIESSYPGPKLAHMAAIEASLATENYENAQKHASIFVRNWDEPRFIHEINNDLIDGVNKAQLSVLFKEHREAELKNK